MRRFRLQLLTVALFLLVVWWIFGAAPAAVFLAVFMVVLLVFWFQIMQFVWMGGQAHRVPLIHVEPLMAVRPSILGHAVPEGYRLCCLFFGTGLIDRTRTLDHGFPYTVLDPVPAVGQARQANLHELCDERARQLVNRAALEGRPVRLLWSGGIDSTAACVALLRAASHDPSRLEIVYSPQSRGEYRRFFREHVSAHGRRRKIRRIAEALDEGALITSGEHGDQIFGSIKALGLPLGELARPWEQTFPNLLRAQLASCGRADAVVSYLSPQLAQCPVTLTTLFDLLWWLNFSMKWQAVSLRMLGSLDQAGFRKVEPHVAHFFRTQEFQQWAMLNAHSRLPREWTAYKEPLKAYIRDFTGDGDYYMTKQKEPSLRNMPKSDRWKLVLAVDEKRRYLLQSPDDSLRRKSASDANSSFSVSHELAHTRGASRERTNEENVGKPAGFEPRREDPLWDDMSSGE